MKPLFLILLLLPGCSVGYKSTTRDPRFSIVGVWLYKTGTCPDDYPSRISIDLESVTLDRARKDSQGLACAFKYNAAYASYENASTILDKPVLLSTGCDNAELPASGSWTAHTFGDLTFPYWHIPAFSTFFLIPYIFWYHFVYKPERKRELEKLGKALSGRGRKSIW